MNDFLSFSKIVSKKSLYKWFTVLSCGIMNTGTLYIIASPIGNMEDITLRALRILKEEVDMVFCEDTRQTKKLLSRYEIDKPATSLHSHSNEKKIEYAITQLNNNKNIAYLTDSGTPGISDPGSKIVRAARDNGIPVVPVPGPSALSSILSVSGFYGKNIIFGGFLSKKPGKRINELTRLKEFDGTIIIYESPNRILKCLTAISEVFTDQEIVIGREITKLYEEFISGNINHIINNIDTITEKGEFTIAIDNNS